MLKRPILLLVLLGGAVLVGLLVAGAFRSGEPEYEDIKLSEWVEVFSRVAPRSFAWSAATGHQLDYPPNKPMEAIQQIGTNGVPYLVKWIRYDPPAWKLRCLALINKTFHSTFIDHEALRAAGAWKAINVLGAKAAAAVPSLALLMNQTYAPTRAARASAALSDLSLHVLAADLALMTNNSVNVRLDTVMKFQSYRKVSPPSLPGLIHCLQDTDVDIAVAAAKALGNAAIEPTVVVPALTNSLQRLVVRKAAIQALGAYGVEARPAALALVALLADPVPVVSRLATNALRQIDPEALERAMR